jgi:hypothetical protein
MTFHEEYARIKVNEAIKNGLKSQHSRRILAEYGASTPKRRNTMNRKLLISIGLVVLIAATLATVAFAGGQDDLAKLRAATAQFHRPQTAQETGYDLVPGLDYCFNNPGVGAMGYHYINTEILDTTVDPLQPEAMVYAPGPNGKLKLAAVEFIVPAEAWEAEGHADLPSAYGHSFHLNEALGVYVLHAWIWKNNPAGMFEDWNPRVSCP